MSPEVSIVIPVHNGMPYIKDALNSVLNQTYGNIETIIVDNASTDGTTEWLRSLIDERLTVIHREELQSAGDNWTQAVNLASGDYIKLLCADDLLDPQIIETQVGLLFENPNAVMAASRRRIIDSKGKILKKKHGLSGLAHMESGASTLRKCFLKGTNLMGEPAAVLFRSGALKTAMPWHSQWPYVTDLATYAKVLNQGDLVTDPRVQASFRIASTSWSANLLKSQQEQFAKWQAHELDGGFIRLTGSEKLISKFQLKARTFARKLFFAREARKNRL